MASLGDNGDRMISCGHKRMHTAGRHDGPCVKYDEICYCEKYRYSDYVDI